MPHPNTLRDTLRVFFTWLGIGLLGLCLFTLGIGESDDWVTYAIAAACVGGAVSCLVVKRVLERG